MHYQKKYVQLRNQQQKVVKKRNSRERIARVGMAYGRQNVGSPSMSVAFMEGTNFVLPNVTMKTESLHVYIYTKIH